MEIGHKDCTSINSSPITTHIHIHIHSNEASIAQKIGRVIYAIIGQRHETIENAESVSFNELQGSIIQKLEDRRSK